MRGLGSHRFFSRILFAPEGAEGGAPPAGEGTPPPDGGQQPQDPPKGAGTLAGGAPKGEEGQQPPKADGAPPADWPSLRAQWAGGDEATAKVLDRYQDGAAFVKAHKGLVDKVASGELRSVKKLAKDATPEQVAEFRKANGIPEKADGYEITLPVGLKLSDGDKAELEGYRAFAHENNLTPETVSKQVDWYMARKMEAAEALAGRDAEHFRAGEEALRKDWSFDYDRNISTVQTLFEGNEELFATVMGARGPDGRKLGNTPEVLKFLVDIGVQANPSIREYAGDGSTTPQGAAARIAEIEALMVDDPKKYNEPAIQEEYRRLLTYQEARGHKVK